MNYLDFKQSIIDSLKEIYNHKATINTFEVLKNNDIHMDGISIKTPTEVLSPTLYLNDLYNRYYVKGVSIDDILSHIMIINEDRRCKRDFDVTFFNDFNKVKGKIAFKLINRNTNIELLKNIPHIPYLDLAICFYCHIASNENGNASILIKNEHLEKWNVTEVELYEIALINTPELFPPKLHDIEELLHTMSNKNPSIDFNDFSSINKDEFFVLSNNINYFGASVILYKDLLEKIGSVLQSSYYIIPSSIHEVIIIPAYLGSNMEDELYILKEMINVVNAECVSREDYLADHAYYYNNTVHALSEGI